MEWAVGGQAGQCGRRRDNGGPRQHRHNGSQQVGGREAQETGRGLAMGSRSKVEVARSRSKVTRSRWADGQHAGSG